MCRAPAARVILGRHVVPDPRIQKSNQRYLRITKQRQIRCLDSFKYCEFFVTANFVKRKQYVNEFLL